MNTVFYKHRMIGRAGKKRDCFQARALFPNGRSHQDLWNDDVGAMQALVTYLTSTFNVPMGPVTKHERFVFEAYASSRAIYSDVWHPVFISLGVPCTHYRRGAVEYAGVVNPAAEYVKMRVIFPDPCDAVTFRLSFTEVI